MSVIQWNILVEWEPLIDLLGRHRAIAAAATQKACQCAGYKAFVARPDAARRHHFCLLFSVRASKSGDFSVRKVVSLALRLGALLVVTVPPCPMCYSYLRYKTVTWSLHF